MSSHRAVLTPTNRGAQSLPPGSDRYGPQPSKSTGPFLKFDILGFGYSGHFSIDGAAVAVNEGEYTP